MSLTGNHNGETTPLFGRAAHAYLAAGWPSILPLPPRAKWPPPEGFTGRNGTWPTRQQVDEWADSRPDGNLALRLPDDVIGIDVDSYGDKPGGQTLAQLEQELGPLPATVMSTSRGDGISGIRLYRTPHRPAWHDPGPGIEVIHSGWRYVVVAPSVHDTTGNPYRWIDQDTGEMVTGAPTPTRLAQLPPAWADRLSSDQDNRKTTIDPAVVARWAADLPVGQPCKAMNTALDTFHADLSSGAARHDVMLKGTAAIVRAIDRGHHGGAAALAQARNQFLLAVTGDGTRSIAQAEAEWQRALTGAYELVAASPTTEADKGCRCGGTDVPTVTTLDYHGPVEDADTGAPDETTRKLDELYPPLDWRALWDSGVDDVDWIVEGIVETGRAAALYAPAKSGKSLFLLELSACVSTGRDFAGQHVPEPRTVLYVDREMSPGDVIDRLKTLGFAPDELDRLVYLSLPSIPPLDTAVGGEHLHALVTRHQADLVVLDTASRVVEGPENDADTYRDYYSHTGQRLKAAGVSVWRLDHAGKDLTRGQRGASAKNDDVDAVWKLSPKLGGRYVLKADMRRTAHGLDDLTIVRNGTGRLEPVDTHQPVDRIDDQVIQLVQYLDRDDVPLDWGRDRVRQHLGIQARNEDISAAIQIRRGRANRPPNATVIDPMQAAVGPVPEPVPTDMAGDRSGDRSGAQS